jgi:tetratricopeptide (TPR) repeat protein
VISLVIVVLATISVASTFVAVRATEARKRALDDLASASKAIDRAAIVATSHKDLKGLKMDPLRKELLQPALEYYQGYVAAHAGDKQLSPEVAKAHFFVAGIQAKQGSMKSVPALNQGVTYLDKMHKAKMDPETFPSLQDTAMKLAPPNEWMILKGAAFSDMRTHGTKLFFALSGAIMTFEDLNKAYPQAVRPRDELSAMLKYSAMMRSSLGQRNQAINNWLAAQRLLETLVRDQPANDAYKARLAEALVGAGRLQKAAKDTAAAIESYQRAVEVREQLAAAKPDDKTLADELAAAKTELEKLKAAAPAAKESAPSEPESPGVAAADKGSAAKNEPASAEKTPPPTKEADVPAAAAENQAPPSDTQAAPDANRTAPAAPPADQPTAASSP